MTSSPPLKVVPPGAKRPTPIEPTESIESGEQAVSPVVESSARSVSKRQVFYLVVLVGLGLGFIPLPTYVTGRAEVGLRDENRQSVSMREAGRLELRVTPQAAVRRGDVVAIIENDELTSQILEQERLVMDTQAAIAAAERRLAVAQAAARQNNTAADFDRQLLDRKLAQLNDIESGVGSSETQRLEAEIAALQSQAVRQSLEQDRFQSEALDLAEQQVKKQEQLAELTARRDELATRFAIFESLIEEGALGYANTSVTTLMDQQSELEIRISSTESELQSLSRQIEERQIMQAGVGHEIDRFAAQTQATRAQIGGVVRDLETESLEGLGAWEERRAEFDQNREEVNLALVELERQEQLAIAHQRTLQQLQARREALHLRADIDGIVITEDLDLKDGQWFNQGDTLFAIAPSDGYDIAARFDQGDMQLFDVGDRAKFVNDTPGAPTVAGRVKIIPTVLDDEETAGDKAELEVTIEPDQVENNPTLSPKVKGYVHIRSPKNLNTYQSIGHQIGKVVNFKRYPPFIWFD
jgi:multidrug resistance efflux pump